MDKLGAILDQFERAAVRLGEALAQEKNDFIRDSAIQRFEFTFDLSWKTIKTALQVKGVACNSPRDCFREAYKQGYTEYDDFWLKLVDLRNLTSHTYKEEYAEKVYAELPRALKHFQELLQNLKIKP